MKRIYAKPAAIIEHFSMAQHIASGCTGVTEGGLTKPEYADEKNCKWDSGAGYVFATIEACEDGYLEDFTWVCLHNPDGDNALFSS